MSSEEMFLLFRGLLLPKETHSSESLKFAQEFTFKDDDVVAVTCPKSGQCFFRLQKTSCFWSWFMIKKGNVTVLYFLLGHASLPGALSVCRWHFLLYYTLCYVLVIFYLRASLAWLTPNSGGPSVWGVEANTWMRSSVWLQIGINKWEKIVMDKLLK